MLSPSKLLPAVALLLTASFSFAQPVNDDCAGAVLLSVGANTNCDNTVAGTTVSATYSGVDYCSFTYGDVWYKFVAVESAHTVSISNATDPLGNPGPAFVVEIFSGDCSSPVHFFCSPFYFTNGDISFGDLVPGNTYFIRIVSPYNQEFIFDICLGTPPAPPANDVCSGAIALSVDPDADCDAVLSGNTTGATTSPVPVCYDCPAADDDIWYTFTATQPNHIIALTNIRLAGNPDAFEYAAINVFSGTCGNFTPVLVLGFYEGGSGVVTNLTPGQTYYLRVFSNNIQVPVTFDLCVTSPLPPANDECTGAVTIVPSPGLYCEVLFTVTTFLSTSSDVNCQGGVANDVWFQFVATSTAHRIELYGGGGPPENGYEVYAGDCGNLTSLTCTSGYETYITLSDLTVGATYYLRVFNAPAYQNYYQQGCILTLPPPPANDECAGAQSMPVNPDISCNLQTNGSTLGAISSAQNCAGTNATHDVWYSFVATGSTHRLQINMNITIFGNSFQFGYEVFSGACDNLTSLACKSFNNNYGPTFLSGLTSGATYYVRVYSDYNSAHEFSICLQTLPPPPANADCTAATVLTPSPVSACTDPTSGTTSGVLTESASTCYYGSGMNVWYSFTATSTAHIVRISDVQPLYGNYEYWVEVYEGADCNNLTYLDCIVYPIAHYLNNLTAGQTYYVRWVSAPSSAHTFNICIGTLPTPANDECANAVALPVNADQFCNSSTAGTTGGSTFVPSGNCFDSGDVWYSFTATQASHQVVFGNIIDPEYGNYQPISVELMSGNCGNLTSINCSPGAIYGNGDLIFGDLIVGETYYLRISHYYNLPVNFNICVLTPPPPPVNDACVNAIDLAPEPGVVCAVATPGTTSSATSSVGVPPVCCGGGDVWYKFTVTQANHTITLSNIVNTAYNYYFEIAGVELYSSTCGSLVLERQTSIYYNGSMPLTHLTPGQTYYVRVIGNNIQGINFDICITAPPAPVNDECANALPLPISEDLSCATSLTVSTLGATQSAQTPVACYGNPSNDIWYQFTASTATYRFDLSATYGNYNDWGFEIFSGDCNNLTSMRCEQPYYNNTFIQNGLVPGETYYVRLFSIQNNVHELVLCTRPIPAPPANDECAGALPVPVNLDLNCVEQIQSTTLGATQSMTTCYGGSSQDVWYSFVATGPSQLVEMTTTYDYFGGGYFNFGFQVYSGECDNLTSMFCTEFIYGNTFLLQNFVPGETYYLRVISPGINAHDFTLCIKSLPPPPANDECAQATPVLPNEGLSCDLIFPGTTLGATFDQDAYSPDVWFSFEATSNSHIFDLLNLNTVLGNPNALNLTVYQGSDCNDLLYLANFTTGYYNTNLLSNLQPGETYYIRVYPGDPTSAYTFDLCIKTLPPSPPNEACSGAFTLTPNTGLDCDITTSGTTAGAIDVNFQNCGGYGNDVWYQFTATAPNHWIQAINITPALGSGALWVEALQSDDCQNYSPLYCSYFDNILYLTGLTTGVTYYVKVASEYGSAHNYDLCVRTIPPPLNDLCANAISLDVAPEQNCGATTGGTTAGAGSSPGVSPCGFDGNDVWYSFSATQGSHTVSVSNVVDAEGGYPAYFGVEVYGGACGSLQNLACRNSLNYNDQFTIGELVAGEVYYVRVFSYYFSGIDFEVCVGTPAPPPPNDACANAVNLPVSATAICETPVAGTTEAATPSPVQPYYGYGLQSNDVWYTFTATQPNHIVTINSDPGSFLFVEVLTGTCGSFTPVVQYYPYYNAQLLLTNLGEGNTYYVRIYETSNLPAAFDICVTSVPAPPNDECAGATLLPVNPDLTCGQTTVESSYGATQSLPSCNGYPVNDVWYKFVSTGTAHRLDVGAYNGYYYSNSFGMEVFEGTCEGLNAVQPCTEYYAYSNLTSVLQNLVAGNTYYIRLFSFPNEFLTFNICVQTLPPPPANDECAQAATIQANSGLNCDVAYNGSTLGATQSALSCYGSNTHDVWYQFTAPGVSQLIEFQMTNTLFSPYGFLGIEVYSGSGCGNLYSLQCFEYTPGTPITLGGLTIGDTYYIRVFSQYNSAHEFSLCIKTLPPPPANDLCTDAQVVTPNEGLECAESVAGSTAGSLDYNYFGCQSGPDVWYQFTATRNFHIIQLQNIVNQYGNALLSLELYQGTDCNNLGTLACSYGGSPIYASYLTDGATYYIRVVGAQNSGTDFDLCVLTVLPPANDECASAVSLPVSLTAYCESVISGTTSGATQTDNPPGCYFTSDVWYSFVAAGTAHTINLDNVTGGNYYELAYEVFSGDCGALTSLGCFSAYTLTAFEGLTPGDTYYVRIATNSQYLFNFDLCVTTSLPDLAIVYFSVNSGACGLGNNETVQAVFYNQGTLTLPAGAVTYNMTLTGVNNGTYGPIVNANPIPPGLYDYAEFTGVDLSNTGFNQFVVTGDATDDSNTANNEGLFIFTNYTLDTFYYDIDGDGYGNPGYFIIDCGVQYEWLVTNDDDCNDYDASVNPAATEVCNGYDDDCDGLTDADDPGVIDMIPPAVYCLPDTVLVNDPGLCSAVLSHNVVSAWDDCSYTLEQTGGPASGSAFPVGTSVVTYRVTDPGGNQASCSFNVEVQKTGDPDLLYAYTVIGFKEVLMKKNTVQSGGVGVVNANKKAILQQNTTVTASNTFVKAPVLQLQNGSQATTYYQGQVAASLLPAFQPNDNPGNNNVTIANNNPPVVLNLDNYGKITVGNNVTVTFSGHAVVRIKELQTGNDATILFAQGTELLIDKKMDIGKNTDINPGGGQAVQFFAEGNVSIDKGVAVSANIYTEKNLSMLKATAANPTLLTGLFIADKVDAQEHVFWNWDDSYCPLEQGSRPLADGARGAQDQPGHNVIAGRLSLFPNPASEAVQVAFDWETTGEATLQLFDATGRLSRNEKFAVTEGSNQYRLDLSGLPEGFYTLQVTDGARRAVEKLVVVR